MERSSSFECMGGIQWRILVVSFFVLHSVEVDWEFVSGYILSDSSSGLSFFTRGKNTSMRVRYGKTVERNTCQSF